MITLLAIALTWYATKFYYTRDLKIHIEGLKEHGLMTAQCSRCSQHIVIHQDNMRNPYYCVTCK